MKKLIPPALLSLCSLFFLSACDVAVLNPKGLIALEQKDLILTSVYLMLIVVIPVLILSIVIPLKYRESNKKAKYDPNFEHHSGLEFTWWAIPIVIITILAVITWKTSHSLDPYKPIESSVKPVEIQVVALDWKWLFIYPEHGVASINEVQFPVNTPVNFKITAQAPMNSFWIPKLAGQIYAMEGMQTLLHIITDHPGDYEGLSANFSGKGFYAMKFVARASSDSEFSTWIEKLKNSGDFLSKESYSELAIPSINNKVQYFSSVEEGLFTWIMLRYMMPEGATHPEASEKK